MSISASASRARGSHGRRTAAGWLGEDRSVGFLLAAALLLCALVLGGGGPHAPVLAAFVEAVAVAPLLWFALLVDHARAGRGSVSGLLILLLILLVPIAQMVPLPPGWWTALPGRTTLQQIVALLQPSPGWHALTLDTEATRGAALALLPAAAMFVATIHLSVGERERLIGLALVIGIASCLLGALQMVATAEAPMYFYRLPPFRLPVGFFANRNHQALFLAGLLPLVAILAGRQRLPLAVAGVFAGLIALTALATVSRSGSALLIPSALGGVGVFLASRDLSWQRGNGRRLWVGMALAVAVLILFALAGPRLLPNVMGRFAGAGADERYVWLPDVLYALRQYFPVGSGLGTFDMTFRAIERLQALGPNITNHAHDDYLEIILETGIAGMLLIVLFLLWWVGQSFRAWRGVSGGWTASARAGSTLVLLTLLQSVVDYPLRTLAMGAMFGFACGLLVRPQDGPAGASRRHRLRLRQRTLPQDR